MSNEIIVSKQSAELAVNNTSNTVAMVHAVMEKVMQTGTHYGTIPGCGSKPTLLKPGADALCLAFGLKQTFEVTKEELEGGHREYYVTCRLLTQDGSVAGEGLGSCSTMEKKYSKRGDRDNQYIADTYNTVLKMAKKRAAVDAVITTTACSDMFTQDIEDFKDTPQAEEHTTILGHIRQLCKDIATTKAINASGKDVLAWIRDEFGCEPDEMGDKQLLEAEEELTRCLIEAVWPPVSHDEKQDASTTAEEEVEAEYASVDIEF